MKRFYSVLLAVIALCGLMTGCKDGSSSSSPTKSNQVELYVFAGAGLTDSLTEIADLYKTIHPEVTLTFNFAASGKLQSQIEEGAPADIFISAAQKQMNALQDEALIVTETRRNLLSNKVVLIVPSSSTLGITSFEDVAASKVSMIAIGDPASVPVGQYSQEIYTTLGTWDVVSAKANLAADVKEVLVWVETGNVDCGIVYSTDAKSSNKVTVVCQAPEGSHKPVTYPAALVAASEHKFEAQEFLDFLSSDEAKAVFEEFGFSF